MPAFSGDIDPKNDAKENQEKAERAKHSDLKLQGEDIPEKYRGKSVAEIIKEAERADQLDGVFSQLTQFSEQQVSNQKSQQQQQAQLSENERLAEAERIAKANIGDDTVMALNTLLQNRMGSVLQMNSERSVREEVAKVASAIKNEYGEDVVGDMVKDLEDRIDQEIKKNPGAIMQLIQPDSVNNLFSMALGRQGKKILERVQKKIAKDQEESAKRQAEADAGTPESLTHSEEFYNKHSGGRLSLTRQDNFSGGERKSKIRYSEDQVAIAKGFGYTPEQLEIDDAFSEGPLDVEAFADYELQKSAKK